MGAAVMTSGYGVGHTSSATRPPGFRGVGASPAINPHGRPVGADGTEDMITTTYTPLWHIELKSNTLKILLDAEA